MSNNFTIQHKLTGLFLLLCLTLLAACSQPEQEPKKELLLQGKTMGTTFNIKVFVPQSQMRELNLFSDVKTVLAEVNQSMSTYIPNSEINQFNALPANEVMPLSADFRQVVTEAIRLGNQTNTLDVTMAPLIDLWGFGPDKRPSKKPEASLLNAMVAQIGVDKLVLTKQGLMKTQAGLELSFSSIAKGYGIDKVAELLQSHNLTNYMIEIGGEMRISGHKNNQQPWRVAIEQPDSTKRDIHLAFEPNTISVATSGDYRNFYEMDGEIYNHLIDPQTGMPIKHDLVSVTVLHQSAMTADGLATALTIMGMEKAKVYAEQHQLPVYLISKSSNGLVTYASSAFKPYL